MQASALGRRGSPGQSVRGWTGALSFMAPMIQPGLPLVVCIVGMILAAAALVAVLWRFCR